VQSPNNFYQAKPYNTAVVNRIMNLVNGQQSLQREIFVIFVVIINLCAERNHNRLNHNAAVAVVDKIIEITTAETTDNRIQQTGKTSTH
jgi:hypothetical protein